MGPGFGQGDSRHAETVLYVMRDAEIILHTVHQISSCAGIDLPSAGHYLRHSDAEQSLYRVNGIIGITGGDAFGGASRKYDQSAGTQLACGQAADVPIVSAILIIATRQKQRQMLRIDP